MDHLLCAPPHLPRCLAYLLQGSIWLLFVREKESSDSSGNRMGSYPLGLTLVGERGEGQLVKELFL